MAETAGVDVPRLVVHVGAEVCVTQAEVTLLTGEVVTTSDPLQLARVLARAYLHPADEEPLSDPGYYRFGYHQVKFALQLAEGSEHKLTVPWADMGSLWQSLCDSIEIRGEPQYLWSETPRPSPRIYLPGKDGGELGTFFWRFCRQGQCHLCVRSGERRQHTLSYDDYVTFVLSLEAGTIGRGHFGLIRDKGLGDTYRWLADMDRRDNPRGRPDQPGNYEYNIISYGL
ncbi:hypothetical protein A2215_03755 [Candidatus Berkelbacteria bacterium RIFOXYA2_FULL_43_10]|uniref:Uncharacterized protein n=1 Tax=Candidatus Berkelbacteria bacterium RIFOXYA2_FULL_43_10 TaxID=1797472 RepID=A0A1F5E4S4_9BACT|nr:MAG: hypothetical protein A2215_03755 [Candidatus Berkelbacteria bacterium RIFOXYA2_FULL_43_10]